VSKSAIYFSYEELRHPFALLTLNFTPQVAQNVQTRLHLGEKKGERRRGREEGGEKRGEK
jgi:hypothetical protein